MDAPSSVLWPAFLRQTHSVRSSPSLPGSKGDMACDRSGAKLEGVAARRADGCV